MIAVKALKDSKIMWKFSDNPIAQDFRELADWLQIAPQHALHPDLWTRRNLFAAHLYQLADDPQNYHSRSVYQAARLFVW